jgi:nitroreductase
MRHDEVVTAAAWLRATSLAWCGPERRLPPQPTRVITHPTAAAWRPPSRRAFAGPPALPVIRALLRAAYGGWRAGRRNVPSAGGMYALRLAVVPLTGRVVHELSASGRLRSQPAPELDEDAIRRAIFRQIEGEAVLIVVSADIDTYVNRYALRGIRYAMFEAGHLCQEAIRGATQRGLASCPLGAFDDAAMQRIVGTRLTSIWPLYALALGYSPERESTS